MLSDAFLEIKSTAMTVRFTVAPFKRALARRGELSTLGGLAENDGYPMPSGIAQYSTVEEVTAGFLTRDLDR